MSSYARRILSSRRRLQGWSNSWRRKSSWIKNDLGVILLQGLMTIPRMNPRGKGLKRGTTHKLYLSLHPHPLRYRRRLNPPSKAPIFLLPARRFHRTSQRLLLQLMMGLLMQQLLYQAPSTPSRASYVARTPLAFVKRSLFNRPQTELPLAPLPWNRPPINSTRRQFSLP